MARSVLVALALAARAAALTVGASSLPKLYVYDHCPFCVRARLALGLKGVKHDIRFMANDDVELPTSMVGKKIAPIFADGVNEPYAESLDIVRNVDADPKYGPTGMFKPLSDRTDLKAWQKSVQTPLRLLQRPRYVQTYLPEFATASARETFVKNHQLPPYEKADWRSDQFTMDERLAMYADQSKDAELIAEVETPSGAERRGARGRRPRASDASGATRRRPAGEREAEGPRAPHLLRGLRDGGRHLPRRHRPLVAAPVADHRQGPRLPAQGPRVPRQLRREGRLPALRRHRALGARARARARRLGPDV